MLVTGPTGSGKSTTLYATLGELSKPNVNVVTCEDPVEKKIDGVNQCQMNPKAGYDFALALRAILRQDPDIVMVGEIRDGETADIAIQAALTGHLVFSTLHTNDAPSSITRLIDMGVPPFLVASSIQAIIAQRLLRTLCVDCKVEATPDPHACKAAGLTDAQIADNTFYGVKGCPTCRGGGYKGRRAIYEIMVMNPRLRDMAFNVATTDQIRDQAVRDGMHTLLMDGVRKALAGVTTVEEVLTVAKRVD
jgi:type II secretory ATPase GspE/PulE/Tfp pilus assembly ATPase PilB-like protein